MQFRVIDGLTVRFAVGGHSELDALLVSPWPETLLAFEPAWQQLAEHARLVAIELPGFGHSQRRDALLSPQAMGGFLITAADAFALEHPHVVGPGIGTTAALFAAAMQPGRIQSLVVGSGAAAVPLRLGGVLKDWVEAPSLDDLHRADPTHLVAAALDGMTRYALPDHIREDYLSAYQGDRMAESLRYLRSYPADLPVLRDLLPRIVTPVEIIAGAYDVLVPPANAEFLHHRLPNSRLDVIDAGHFTWEDAAAEYAALVTGWWCGGHEANGPKGAGT